MIAVVESSIRRQGVLADCEDDDGYDIDAMANVVSVFYGGVRRVWPDAWSGTPWTSRLVHGAGLVAMGALMDIVMREVDPNAKLALSSVARRLHRIEHGCAWTSGHWEFSNGERRGWNEIQNTGQDKRRLTDHLVSLYGGDDA